MSRKGWQILIDDKIEREGFLDGFNSLFSRIITVTIR